jgi:hypothetical protein
VSLSEGQDFESELSLSYAKYVQKSPPVRFFVRLPAAS